MGFGGSGGTSSVAGSSDVAINNPVSSHVLTYDGSQGKWKNAVVPLPAASTSVAGIVRLATQLEVTDGVDATRAVSPATLAQKLSTLGQAGSQNVLVWRYASGAYPVLSTTKPAGVEVVLAYGPVQPTVIPSWIGTGANQVIAKYEYTNLT